MIAKTERSIKQKLKMTTEKPKTKQLPTWSGNIDQMFQYAILALIIIYAFSIRLYSAIQYESIIHEYDPWFNYRVAKYISENGFAAFTKWFDTKAWYPQGREIYQTSYFGMMYTSALIHRALAFLRLPVHIREVCVFTGPVFAGGVCANVFSLTKMAYGPVAALFAAAFVAGVPGYIARSVAGSYDYECFAIFTMTLSFLAWANASRSGKAWWAAASGMCCFYMVSVWGGYLFVMNLIAVHAFALFLMNFGAKSQLYKVYSIHYVISTALTALVPFVSRGYFTKNTHLPALFVFLLLQVQKGVELFLALFPRRHRRKAILLVAIGLVVSLVVVPLFLVTVINTSLTGRIYHILGLDHGINIVNSVSEHQRSSWKMYQRELLMLILLFPVGFVVMLCSEKDEVRILLLQYVFFSGLFSIGMVRLILVFAPAVCIFSGVSVSFMLECLASLYKKVSLIPYKIVVGLLNIFAAILVFKLYLLYFMQCDEMASVNYSSPTVILSYKNMGKRLYIDDYREAFLWLRYNTASDAKVLSWWDYGYQITGFANRTVYVDNNTNDEGHIARIGRILSAPEEKAYKDILKLDVDYLLVLFGGRVGYDGDDVGKSYWIMKITSGYHKDIHEQYNFHIDDRGTYEVKNSLLFKMMYYRFDEINQGYDHARREYFTGKVKFDHLEEAFTSSNWMIRVYRVKKPKK